MRRIGLSFLLFLFACQASTNSAPSATGQSVPAVPSSTTTTTPAPTATTTVPEAEYTVDDCDTPPVTFALLCDVHQLLFDYHVDAPLDPAALAAGASLGIQGFEGSDRPEPTSFVCAVPDAAFESSCDLLAERTGGDAELLEEAVEDGVASMIAFSLDPFTYYIPPELSGALTEDGVVNAVGLLLSIRDEAGSACTVIQSPCRLEVVLALVESPSYEAGLRPGDVIVAIDGETVEGATLVEVAALLDGPEGSSVTVDVDDGAGGTDQFVIERRPPPVLDLEAELTGPDTGYIRLPDFAVDVPSFLHSVLQAWTEEDLSNLVLDLRDNPGGFVDVATIVASEFLSDGLVVRSESPTESLDYPVQDGGLMTSGPNLWVVVNSGSASASEIVAGVLQERGRATIVGEPTFGKNTVQIGFPLLNDGELRVTVARWVTPEGQSVAGTGVAPDVSIEIPPDATPPEVVDLVLG